MPGNTWGGGENRLQGTGSRRSSALKLARGAVVWPLPGPPLRPPLRPLLRLLLRPLLWLLLSRLVWPLAARAQYVPTYFPAGVPGYDQELGVTVVTRVRPLFQEQGIRAGSFIIRPDLDESVGYNSNVLGYSGGPGSPVIETAPSLSVNSDWSRNAIGASISADDQRYLNTPAQSFTNWNAALGGSYTLGRGDATVGYSHSVQHESPTDIGAPPTATPIPFTVDDVRTSATIDLGRFRITPNVEFSAYRYGTADVIDQPANQAFRNSDVIRGGAAIRYELSEQRALLLVLQGIDSNYINQQPGAVSMSSTSGLVLGGIDYQYDGLWRYQLLAGLEVRSFAAANFSTRVAPIAKATAIWTPTGLTTVTGTLLRTLDEPVEEGTSGFTYSSAELRVDHEYRRNILLNGELGTRLAEYQQGGGTQIQYYASAGVTWLLNRRMSLNGQYSFTVQNVASGSSSSVNVPAVLARSGFDGNYNQNVFTVTLHIGL